MLKAEEKSNGDSYNSSTVSIVSKLKGKFDESAEST